MVTLWPLTMSAFPLIKGEIVDLLGHNGANITTIMEMISGYLEPNAGHIEIDEPIRRRE